jgi:hypothetical protein
MADMKGVNSTSKILLNRPSIKSDSVQSRKSLIGSGITFGAKQSISKLPDDKKKKRKKKLSPDEIKKNHISFIVRRSPLRFRIIAFAQKIAVLKIQRIW